MNKQELIENFLDKNYLVSPDFFDDYDEDEEILFKLNGRTNPLVLNKDLCFILKKNNKILEINWLEFEKSRVLLEKGRDSKIYQSFLDILLYNVNEEKKQVIDNIIEEIKKPESVIIVDKDKIIPNVTVLDNFNFDNLEEKDVNSFVSHYKFRYNALKDILVQRAELNNVVSINKVLNRKDKSPLGIIGLIQDKKKTQNGHILLQLEDPTGVITVLINKDRDHVFRLAENLVLDEAIGITGVGNGEIVFCDNIYFPDIPLTKEIKKSPEDVAVAFISDIHVGSKNFLEKEFVKFIQWLNAEKGDKKQIESAKKIRYLFLIGDLVEGVGVYPDQFDNLTIKDVAKQYDRLAEYLDMIRKDIYLIVSPGDHDALRLEHPQPVLDKKIASKLWDLKNIVMVSNPAFVNIHSSQNFPGFNILMYHGHGYHYYMGSVDPLKMKDVSHNPRHVMSFLLQKRHLAPTHTSTIYVPDHKEDPLVMKRVPDIFVSGHLHKSDVSSYNNVITINSSCWQSQTDFEIKVGNFPDPCKVPVLNLKTREVEVLDFND